MISKELLSVILKTNVTEVYKSEKGVRYKTSTKMGEWESNSDVPLENIYEFCHLCKDWLFNEKDVMFDVRFHTNSNPRKIVIMTYGKDSKFYVGNSEAEAVIKLCEYILSKDKL